jgi:hypothetical protein
VFLILDTNVTDEGRTDFSVPCSITFDEFKREFKMCDTKLSGMWKANKVDPRLCRSVIHIHTI